MKKTLIVTSVASMIDQFNMPNIEVLKELNYEVHVAANFNCGSTSSAERKEEFKDELKNNNIPYHHVDFSRDLGSVILHLKAIKQLKSILHNNEYEFIHCQSPIGGVITRVIGYFINTPVIYTAHGFHFFEGAPLKNWILFYPIEKLLANYTDVIITINKEDYKLAKDKFNSDRIEYIPGVGIDLERFKNVKVSKDKKCNELNLPNESFNLLSVGELNKNKNHEVIIKALAKLNNPKLHYLICGKGPLKEYLKEQARKLGVKENVHLLGFRRDIEEIYNISNLFVFPSLREGLSVALMEAMASGLPVVCSNIRGNVDLIEDEEGGYLIDPNNVHGFSEAIEKAYKNAEKRKKFGQRNLKYIKKHSKKEIKNILYEIYDSV
ncbi:glycosyltransferase family 4 protein [Halarsenatibacter silvermanii]|uniref:Glycosyltransferase involved in cell wall bisynthesis n=1 Tax=Halarsenatibacter silvermanii TaxID=321763 RepID=A0A1G9S9V3_9FIRM|nr:glycosyltransferase family 4 protein [Halarsenatibacter silvermanii]SDM32182.1 Glycosyltransferase involved in cell wall bisynthesis [Halarsenatibacter silvermanii]